MLVGRESLIRLIGKKKRRRSSLSPRLSLLFHPIKSSSSTPPQGDNGGSASPGPRSSSDHAVSDPDWVTCPVCGKNVRGTNYLINSHLDTCLTRGRTRKLTQRTLISFCSRLNDDVCNGEFLANDAREKRTEETMKSCISVCLTESSSMTEEESNNREPEHCLPNNTDTHTHIILDNVVSEHASTDKEVTLSEASSFTPGTNVKADGLGTMDGVSVVSLETFIVGRRFHDEVELWQGAEISVLRDPENVSDANALKVLLTDSGSSHMLGFLPRELAEHLSPLIDKFHIKIEGSVTSLPNCSRGVVPIRISCHQMMQEGEMDDNNRQLLRSSWGNCLHVVEDINRFPPYQEKYQHNFIIMIHEVLKQEAHLFDDDEKRFLELFDSLPDDSQRLLIRLYTRKGPWFRMANVSYPEISDSNNAIEELHDAGYVCFFQSKGPSKCEVDEVMNALTVLELRQILNHIFPKKDIRFIKKQELISFLSDAYDDGKCPMLPSMLLERSGICVRVSCTADLLLWRVQRLFFLNGEQDLSSFLLVDLGLVKYPNYTCNTSLPIFRNRSDLLAYEEALDVAEMMDHSLDANDLDTVMRCIEISDDFMSSSCKNISLTPFPDAATFLSCFTASWVYSKVVALGVSFFECEQRFG